MNTKILIARPSKRPTSETMLDEEGPLSEDVYLGAALEAMLKSYELRIEIYTEGMIPDKAVIVGINHYDTVFQKYSMDDLKAGVKIDSIFSVMETIEVDGEIVLEEEVDNLAQKIIDDYKKYPSADLKSFLVEQILSLKNKFKIQPK